MSEHILHHWLAEIGLLDPSTPPPTGVAMFPTPATDPGDPRATSYAEAALRREAEAVASCPEGGRNHALNRAAFSLEGLVVAGYLDGQYVVSTLTQAARKAGLGEVEIAKTIRSGKRAGAAHPRQVALAPQRSLIAPAFVLDQPMAVNGNGSHPPAPATTADPVREKLRPGGAFLFDQPSTTVPVWGNAEHVLWAPGESLMVVGPPGVGKSTVAQQLTLARTGLAEDFLGFPVQATTSRVLYLAMDRPRQIARSMRRMVTDDQRDKLDATLIVWEGPLPCDVAARPSVLLYLAEMAGADTIFVDSLKDAANGMVDSERAGAYNRARQMVLAAGVEMVEIAHQRKANGDRAPKTLADVHGGMEITAGAGSVFLVWGDAGDPIVEFRHLKQPADVVGPLDLMHEPLAGRTTVMAKVTPNTVLSCSPRSWFTAAEVAHACTDGAKPSRASIERVRRQLDRLVRDGSARRLEDHAVAGSRSKATTYSHREPTAFPSSTKDTDDPQ